MGAEGLLQSVVEADMASASG
eukprot:COSAG06_NODE_59378_length_274_cov_0.777143_1_plen_20_part_10